MGRYEVRLAGERQVIEADGFSQVGEYVSFFHRIDGVKTSFALARMGQSDSVVEHVTKSAKSVSIGKDDLSIVYYGPHPCAGCGHPIVKMCEKCGGWAYDPPVGPVYPNSTWPLHKCKPTSDLK